MQAIRFGAVNSASRTHWVHDIDPLLCFALDELPADEILRGSARRTCALPLLRKLLGLCPGMRAQTSQRALDTHIDRGREGARQTRGAGQGHGTEQEHRLGRQAAAGPGRRDIRNFLLRTGQHSAAMS